MAIIQNDGKRERRRPSLKGGVMLDVVNGSERARAWPKKRGKPKSQKTADQNEWFRQAQWATKFMPAEMYWQIASAVQGTPLLPRDILTMMMAGRLLAFTMPDGRTMWSVQVSNDVSQALDVIADVPGSLLLRGPDGWQAILPGPNGYVLKSRGAEELPEWEADGGGGGGSGWNQTASSLAYAATAFASKGTLFLPAADCTISSAMFHFNPEVGATAGYDCQLVLLNGSNVIQAIVATVNRTGLPVGQATHQFDFPSAAPMIAGNRYGLMLTRRTIPGGNAFGFMGVEAAAIMPDIGRAYCPQYLRGAVNLLAVGQTLTAGPGPYWCAVRP